MKIMRLTEHGEYFIADGMRVAEIDDGHFHDDLLYMIKEFIKGNCKFTEIGLFWPKVMNTSCCTQTEFDSIQELKEKFAEDLI